MSYNNFKSTVWSQNIQRDLEKYTVLANDCNYEFEGEAKFNERVKILGVSKPTIGTYTGGDIGNPEEGLDSSVYLDIDQAKFFNFAVDDVDKAQSRQGLLEALLQESTHAMACEIDSSIAKLAMDCKQTKKYTLSSSAEAKKAVDEALVVLRENGVAPSMRVVVELTPWVYDLFSNEIITLNTDNTDLIEKGILGMYKNAYVKMSNNLYSDGTYDFLLVRSDKAIAIAKNVESVESYRPQGSFKDAIKGLTVWGVKTVRPKELYVIQAKRA